MKLIIKIIILLFIINSTQVFASDLSIDQDASIDGDRSIDREPSRDINININKVQTELKARLANAKSMHNLTQFYQNRQYKPVWIDENGISEAGQYAFDAFTDVGGEGLDPNDYKQALQAVDDFENNPEKATEAEIILTKAALQYIDDVNGNRLNSQKVPNELFVKKSVIPAAKILAENMKADPSGAWLTSYTINNPHYQDLKELLAEYRQNLQGSPSGARGMDRKIQQIVINMERWRYLPEKMPERYALINIAAFDLKCIENDKVVLQMPVVIGKNERKTPVLVSTVNSIKFKPEWNLPHHIAVEDSLPKIQANPSYIFQRKYILYNSAGQEINPYSVNWGAVNANTFKYRLKQIPGPHNVMGNVRFELTNSHGIYLHDTSEPEKFNERIRNYSSGCVRLKHPDLFAYFVFNDEEKWPLSKIRENMEGTLTTSVPLDRHLPVYLTYFTVWKNEEGQMQFAEDVYDRDQQLLKALNYPLSEIPSSIEGSTKEGDSETSSPFEGERSSRSVWSPFEGERSARSVWGGDF